MKKTVKYTIIFACVALGVLVACHSTRKDHFKGCWTATISSDDGEAVYQYTVRLDPYNATVCADGFENKQGIMTITEDQAVPRVVTTDVVTKSTIDGNQLHIEYIQESSGQLWSGTFTIDNNDNTLTFVNGEMLAPGPDGSTTPVELPYAVNPSKLAFDFVDARPNYKKVPLYNLIYRLPDRVYYRYALADEQVAPPFGDVQIRCYFPDTDKDIHITNEIGDAPLSAQFSSTIVDCWPLPDETGLMMIIWTGTRKYQKSILYRIDESNKFVAVDVVSGRRPASYDLDEQPDSTQISRMIRKGTKVRVFDPFLQEERNYDLSGRRL